MRDPAKVGHSQGVLALVNSKRAVHSVTQTVKQWQAQVAQHAPPLAERQLAVQQASTLLQMPKVHMIEKAAVALAAYHSMAQRVRQSHHLEVKVEV